jgi:hypothetical protein
MEQLTLTLPQPIFQHLQEVAAATQQSLEQVALQSIAGSRIYEFPDPALPQLGQEVSLDTFGWW